MQNLQIFILVILFGFQALSQKHVNIDSDETIYYTGPSKKDEKTDSKGSNKEETKTEEAAVSYRYQQTPPKLQSFSGTVRIVRTSPVAEAFFVDLNQSFVIPKNDSYYGIYNELLNSQKTKKPVSFMADPKNRVIYSINPEEVKKEGDSSKDSVKSPSH